VEILQEIGPWTVLLDLAKNCMTQQERKWSERGNGEEKTELLRNTTGQTDKRRMTANTRKEKKKICEKIIQHGIKTKERKGREAERMKFKNKN
jgi:hypothetical protein